MNWIDEPLMFVYYIPPRLSVLSACASCGKLCYVYVDEIMRALGWVRLIFWVSSFSCILFNEIHLAYTSLAQRDLE